MLKQYPDIVKNENKLIIIMFLIIFTEGDKLLQLINAFFIVLPNKSYLKA